MFVAWELFLYVRKHSALLRIQLRSKALSTNSDVSENENQAQLLDVIKKLSYFSVYIHQNLELTPLSGEILSFYISNHK